MTGRSTVLRNKQTLQPRTDTHTLNWVSKPSRTIISALFWNYYDRRLQQPSVSLICKTKENDLCKPAVTKRHIWRGNPFQNHRHHFLCNFIPIKDIQYLPTACLRVSHCWCHWTVDSLHMCTFVYIHGSDLATFQQKMTLWDVLQLTKLILTTNKLRIHPALQKKMNVWLTLLYSV